MRPPQASWSTARPRRALRAALLCALVASAAAPAFAGSRAPLDPTYVAECASCHIPYPPRFLPAASWRALMGNLGDHFGTDASLDAQTVAASDKEELERIKANFLIKKLGLKDGPSLMEGINAAVDTYGKSERNKFRAVFYYLLVKHFGKESVYA